MSEQPTTTVQPTAPKGNKSWKVNKAWRLHPDIVKAIEDGFETHEYPTETAYVEAIFRRVFGLPDPPKPKPIRISGEPMELRS
jgi:hypothetical protein